MDKKNRSGSPQIELPGGANGVIPDALIDVECESLSVRGAKQGADDSELEGPAIAESAFDDVPSGVEDLPGLLGRKPTMGEQAVWTAMSPSLRQRAAKRLVLLACWQNDRGNLTADDAARIADVTPKRFYQMASLWKKQTGLAAVGAYVSAPAGRKARIDPCVNAALQAVVAKVVKAAPENASVESLRRAVEAAATLRLSNTFDANGNPLKMPSMNVVRAIVVREQYRQKQQKHALGNSIAGDCCATTMLTPDGAPYILFGIIDRATRQVIGWALGSVDEGLEAYGRAAAVALSLIDSGAARRKWADECKQVNLVETSDHEAWRAFEARIAGRAGLAVFQPSTKDRRYGGNYRRIIGDRIGRIVFRPSWTEQPPESVDGERFDLSAATFRINAEMEAYNASLSSGGGATMNEQPPAVLVELLRLLSNVPGSRNGDPTDSA